VPVYRKLGDFNSKRVREIIHAVLANLDDKDISETLPEALRERSKLIDRSRAIARDPFSAVDAVDERLRTIAESCSRTNDLRRLLLVDVCYRFKTWRKSKGIEGLQDSASTNRSKIQSLQSYRLS
jgi:RecG-like helicase